MDDTQRRKRLLYQATHRGFKEADLVVGSFARSRLNSMGPAELDLFESLLDAGDHDLYQWILGAHAPANLEGSVLDDLRSHCRNGGAAVSGLRRVEARSRTG